MDTFFSVSVERAGLIVQDTPMQDEGQQVADEMVEVEELVADELDAAQETETDAEPAAEVEVEEFDETAAVDFQVCVDGHQPPSDPGPGPGPSLGPFCSDILSWSRCCALLVIRLAASRSPRKRTASLRRTPPVHTPPRIIGSCVCAAVRDRDADLSSRLPCLRVAEKQKGERPVVFLSSFRVFPHYTNAKIISREVNKIYYTTRIIQRVSSRPAP